MLLVLYLISFIDRANIGNAKIEGLLPDLNMTGTQYNIALAIFFIPYTLAEVPSNAILNLFDRPSIFMGAIITAWGIVMTCHGFVRNFAELCGVRVLLGLFEAGFFPGAILLISKWYLPGESQTRIAIFFTASAIAGAFSGLLAFGIANMDGVGGYEGWRWVISSVFSMLLNTADIIRSSSWKASPRSRLVWHASGSSWTHQSTPTVGSRRTRSATLSFAKLQQVALGLRAGRKRRLLTGVYCGLLSVIGRSIS